MSGADLANSPSRRDGMSEADEKRARRKTCMFMEECGKAPLDRRQPPQAAIQDSTFGFREWVKTGVWARVRSRVKHVLEYVGTLDTSRIGPETNRSLRVRGRNANEQHCTRWRQETDARTRVNGARTRGPSAGSETTANDAAFRGVRAGAQAARAPRGPTRRVPRGRASFERNAPPLTRLETRRRSSPQPRYRFAFRSRLVTRSFPARFGRWRVPTTRAVL